VCKNVKKTSGTKGLKQGHLLPFDILLVVINLDTYKSVVIATSNLVVSYSDNEFETVACNFLTTPPLEFLLGAHTNQGCRMCSPQGKSLQLSFT
jgi:hypothetical protein